MGMNTHLIKIVYPVSFHCFFDSFGWTLMFNLVSFCLRVTCVWAVHVIVHNWVHQSKNIYVKQTTVLLAYILFVSWLFRVSNRSLNLGLFFSSVRNRPKLFQQCCMCSFPCKNPEGRKITHTKKNNPNLYFTNF